VHCVCLRWCMGWAIYVLSVWVVVSGIESDVDVISLCLLVCGVRAVCSRCMVGRGVIPASFRCVGCCVGWELCTLVMC
jgi:hypothetical protein